MELNRFLLNRVHERSAVVPGLEWQRGVGHLFANPEGSVRVRFSPFFKRV